VRPKRKRPALWRPRAAADNMLGGPLHSELVLVLRDGSSGIDMAEHVRGLSVAHQHYCRCSTLPPPRTCVPAGGVMPQEPQS